MAADIINVHVPLAIEARLYFDYLRRNFLHTAKRPERIFFFVYALDEQVQAAYGSSTDISVCYPVYEMKGAYRLKTWHEWKIFLHAKLTGKSALRGSNGHAAGLNRIMQALPTMAGHHFITDSDVAMIVNGWDEIALRHWKDFDVIATCYEDIGGFSSGSGKVQTYKKLPTPMWFGVREGCDISGMDWMPLKETNLPITTPELSRTYNLPVGYELVRDVGWRIPSFLEANGFRVNVMKHVSPTSPEIQVLKTGHDYSEEYQLDGQAFVGHQRGGSRHEFRRHDMSKRFYECVEAQVGAPEEYDGSGSSPAAANA